MSGTVSRCFMSFVTSQVTGRWFEYTFDRCGPITDAFCSSVHAFSSLGKRSLITTGLMWRLSSPPWKTSVVLDILGYPVQFATVGVRDLGY